MGCCSKRPVQATPLPSVLITTPDGTVVPKGPGTSLTYGNSGMDAPLVIATNGSNLRPVSGINGNQNGFQSQILGGPVSASYINRKVIDIQPGVFTSKEIRM
jgi:hypothetical protein